MSEDKDPLQTEIDRIISLMSVLDPKTETYSQLTDQLAKLHKLKVDERPQGISRETLASILANLFGILIIVRHERANVIASKALNFVSRLR